MRHDLIHLNYPSKTMFQMVQEAARRHPGLDAYEFLGRRISYPQLIRRIEQAARAFYAMGIRRGDRVAICMPNCPQAVTALYGLNRLGAVAVMVHPLSAPGELVQALDLSGTQVVLTLDRLVPNFAAARPGRIFLTARLPGEGPRAKGPGLLRWRAVLRAGNAVPLPRDRGCADDPAVILFSGGTTGTPKGIVLTNQNFNASALQTLAAADLGPTEGLRMLALLPLFHGFGLGIGVHTALLGGACCVLVPRFRAGDLGTLLRRTRPNLLPGVPALFMALLQCREPLDLRGLKGVFCGGDALSAQQKQDIDRFLADHGAAVTVRPGYGLTECVSASCLTPAGEFRPGSIGLPLADMDYVICRPGTTEILPPGSRGEICLTGPTVMVEYIQNREETGQALRRHGDGRLWLHTGDLGTMDADGWVYFTQRLKRMIVSCGYNIYPAQVEAVLELHPKVKAACVVGAADDYRGQRVRAVIVPADPGLTAEEIRVWCRSRIARYAQPREIVFRNSLPMTKFGKVDYRTLEEG